MRAQAGGLRPDDVFPAVRLLGRCMGCGRLVFDHQPHEWANRNTHELCWPYDTGAALYCGRCSDGQRDTPATT